jgi:class 3 adenylate cyclase
VTILFMVSALEIEDKSCHSNPHLFQDVIGFTSMSKQVPPESVMTFLNKLFSLFDCLSDKYAVQKIETAGDCYVAATGILEDDGEGFSVVKESSDATGNAMRMLQFAKAMLMLPKFSMFGEC